MVLFSLPLREGLLSLATPTGIINFRLITAQQAWELWQQGSPYVLITYAGALRYFKRTQVKVIVGCLAACKTPEEVRALRRVRPGSTVLARACALRLRALRELCVRGV